MTEGSRPPGSPSAARAQVARKCGSLLTQLMESVYWPKPDWAELPTQRCMAGWEAGVKSTSALVPVVSRAELPSSVPSGSTTTT